MADSDEKRVREIVRDELLGIIQDGQQLLGMKKDPTGMGRKALETLADLIRNREVDER
ncbi:MAG: hypothetical protein WKF30_13085 [Pyrinomonadaceae bacterium]